jgi:FtsZ-binding cell division protein ZapB
MGQEQGRLKEPTQAIQEIEGQLDALLQKKIEDIERDLAIRISQEKEAARKKKEEVEREFLKEKDTLGEYRNAVRAAEEERDGLLREARQHFDTVVHLQAEIEGLAKATVEEIRKVTDIQQRVEELRDRTAERAGFLRTDLRERFGIVTEVPDTTEKPLALNLDQELDKLRKIKELLAVESAAVGLGGISPPGQEGEEFASLGIPEVPAGFRMPEIQDLVEEAPLPETGKEAPAEVTGGAAAGPSEPGAGLRAEPGPAAAEEESEEAVRQALESCRRSEDADGDGEVSYFQKDSKILVDGESLFAAIDKTADEARRLSDKLGRTESPKDQFFIKQELINWQEGLRALFLKVIKMTEKKTWDLPDFTTGILNSRALRDLLERLSMENWSNPEDFAAFQRAAAEIELAFLARISPRGPYLRALKRELEGQ